MNAKAQGNYLRFASDDNNNDSWIVPQLPLRSDSGKLKLLYCWKTIFLIDSSIYWDLNYRHVSIVWIPSCFFCSEAKRYLEGVEWRFTEDWNKFSHFAFPRMCLDINFHSHDEKILEKYFLEKILMWQDKFELNYFHLFKGDIIMR